MTEHLTEQQIESFRRRKLSPEGLRTAHQHLAACEMCRTRLGASGQVALAFGAFKRELQQADAEDDHLLYQQLSGYVDDELHEIDREIVESHLEACAVCAAEVHDLRDFKSTITAREHETARKLTRSEQYLAWWKWGIRPNPIHAAAAAAVIILIFVAALLLLRPKVSRQDKAEIAQAPQTSSEATPQNLPALPSPSAPPQVKEGGPPDKPSDINRVSPSTQPEKQSTSKRGEGGPAPTSQIVVTLKDGERVVTMDSRGQINGVAASEPGVQRLVTVALRSERLEKPPALDRLIRGSSTQLDIPGDGSSFALQRPVGTVVQSDRPTFTWKPLDGASGYVVSVFDSHLDEVARSESLTTTVWSPPRALQRGAIYRWQVIALKDGREVVLPSPTAPEAKFKVLEQEQSQALMRARRRYADSHLVLGVLYARRGLLDDAETELQALVKDNPTSTVARKLLASLQAWRAAQQKLPVEGAGTLRPEQ